MQSPDGAAVAGPLGVAPAGGEVAGQARRRNLFLDDFLHSKRAMGGCARRAAAGPVLLRRAADLPDEPDRRQPGPGQPAARARPSARHRRVRDRHPRPADGGRPVLAGARILGRHRQHRDRRALRGDLRHVRRHRRRLPDADRRHPARGADVHPAADRRQHVHAEPAADHPAPDAAVLAVCLQAGPSPGAVPADPGVRAGVDGDGLDAHAHPVPAHGAEHLQHLHRHRHVRGRRFDLRLVRAELPRPRPAAAVRGLGHDADRRA